MRVYDVVVSLDAIFADNKAEALEIAKTMLREGCVGLEIANESDEVEYEHI